MTSHHGELAAQAAISAGQDPNGNPTSEALSAVALALLDVAEAIREASRQADDNPQVKHSRNW